MALGLSPQGGGGKDAARMGPDRATPGRITTTAGVWPGETATAVAPTFSDGSVLSSTSWRYNGTSIGSGTTLTVPAYVSGQDELFVRFTVDAGDSADGVQGVWEYSAKWLEAPANISAPSIPYSADVGDVLTISPGSWSGTYTTTTYQWKRDGSDISGATGASYTTVLADDGASLTVTETRTNLAGAASKVSNGCSVAATAPGVPAEVKLVLGLLGQSNQAGFVPQPALFEDYPAGVMQIKQDGSIVQATSPLDHPQVVGGTFAYNLQFVKDVLAEHPTAEILLVPVAEGGTGFSNGDWGVGDPLYATAAAQMTAAVTDPAWSDADVYILWCQGERDKFDGTTEADYVTEWRAMRAGIESAMGRSAEWMLYDLAKQYHNSPPVQAMRNTLRYDAGVHLVRGGVQPLISTGDDTHYDNTSGGADLVGSHHFTGAVAAGWVSQTPAPAPLAKVSMWGDWDTSAATTYTFSPTWTGGTDHVMVILCGIDGNQGGGSLTVDGAPVAEWYRDDDPDRWIAVHIMDSQGSGDVAYTASGELTTYGLGCVVIEYNGDDTMILDQKSGLRFEMVPGNPSAFVTAFLHGAAGNISNLVDPGWTDGVRIANTDNYTKYALEVGIRNDKTTDMSNANNVDLKYEIAGIADSIKVAVP